MAERRTLRAGAAGGRAGALGGRDQILEGDCVQCMRRLPAACVDMVFADPPYNLQLERPLTRPNNSRVDGVAEAWDQFENFAAYDAFSRAWLTEARRVLKPHGTIWVMGSYHNIFRLGTCLMDLGYWLLNDIVWRKTNPMPHFRARRFANAHETLIWAAHSKKARYVFHYHALKTGNEDVQMRSDWHLPICAGKERLKDDAGRKLHPTQKPEALLHRVLLASTRVGDVVLDPFFGTGTTGVAARRLRRHYIGIEQHAPYLEAARARLSAVTPLARADVEQMAAPGDAPRIAFGQLLERGMIRPGTRLFDKARRYQARVRADGSLSAEGVEGVEGSIHKVGAQLQDAASCNGWTFWHVAQGRDLVPLDDLRARARVPAQSPRPPRR